MTPEVESYLVATVPLQALALIAALLALTRSPAAAPVEQRRRVARQACWLVLFQLGHLVEEAATGFPREFPPVFGYPPWDPASFVVGNLLFVGLWLAAAAALPTAGRLALWPLWLLALGAGTNLAIHLGLAWERGAYFPGTASAFVTCPLGLWLTASLWRLTRKRE